MIPGKRSLLLLFVTVGLILAQTQAPFININNNLINNTQPPPPLNLIPYPASQDDCDSCVTVMETIRQNGDLHDYQLTELVYSTCEKTSLRNLEDFCETVVADINGYQTQIQNGMNDHQLCELPIPDCTKFWTS